MAKIYVASSWRNERQKEVVTALRNAGHEVYDKDFDAMKWADVCVLVAPSGRSAHLEAGYMAGQGKPCLALLDDNNPQEPDLMYLLLSGGYTEIDEIISALEEIESEPVDFDDEDGN